MTQAETAAFVLMDAGELGHFFSGGAPAGGHKGILPTGWPQQGAVRISQIKDPTP